MGNNIISTSVAILTAIVGVAIIAVILSQKSDTSNVITTAGKAFQTILGKAVQPVSN